jgi:hypothetical protein
MKQIKYVTPDGVEPPTTAAPEDRRVRDSLMAEDIKVPMALNRCEAYVKSMGPGAIDIKTALGLARARFALLPSEIEEVVTETAYAMLLKTAKNRGHARALIIGAPFNNAKRTTLLEWLARYEDLAYDDRLAIVVVEMGAFDASA